MKKYFLLSFSLLLLSIFLGRTEIVSAEITNPYTVDEKSQVLFGDSALVSTYLGLENYIQDYVDEYIHISFTYTHSSCCFASYPPILYITDVDPRETSTPTVKSMAVIYQLLTIPIPPGNSTDWYLYDIQFDATGYRIIVKQAGDIEIINEYREIDELIDGDWVALANMYPIQSPTFFQGHSMSFTPIQIRSEISPPDPQIPNPVIIIPGIMGSYLNREDGTEVWMNLPKMILPGDDSYLNELILSSSGQQINFPPLRANEIIRNTGSEDFFNGLIQALELRGYKEDQNLFIFPYDWRLDVEDSVASLSKRLKTITSQTGSSKLDIIAHSMGGLVVKEYLRDYGGNNIGKFIDVGTPHRGSSKSSKILMYGDDLNASIIFGLLGLNNERTKIISQNMPSVYELLPSMSYGTYLYDLDDLDNNSVTGPLSYIQTKEFMKNTGRNPLLIDRAEEFHQNLDNLNPADYGVETYNFVGCGTPTLDKIFILDKEASGGIEYNISFTSGDGTVPLKSAEALSSDEIYYLHNATHALMPSATGVKESIVSILKNEAVDTSTYPNLTASVSGCSIPDGKVVSFHSPIELHIYDQNGNHVGPNIDGDIDHGIPEVIYEIIDDNKFAFLPDGNDYIVKGISSGTGSFNVRVEKIEEESVIDTEYFSSIPLTNTTQVEVVTNTVLIDNDGDGNFEEIVFSDNTDLDYLISFLKEKIQNLDIKDKFKKSFLKKIENLEKKIAKKQEKDKSLEDLKKKINNIINRLIEKAKKDKIKDPDAQEVINLFEEIESKL